MRELSFQVVCTNGVHFSFAYFSICSNVKQRVRADWFLGVEDFSFDVVLQNILNIFLIFIIYFYLPKGQRKR